MDNIASADALPALKYTSLKTLGSVKTARERKDLGRHMYCVFTTLFKESKQI